MVAPDHNGQVICRLGELSKPSRRHRTGKDIPGMGHDQTHGCASHWLGLREQAVHQAGQLVRVGGVELPGHDRRTHITHDPLARGRWGRGARRPHVRGDRGRFTCPGRRLEDGRRRGNMGGPGAGSEDQSEQGPDQLSSNEAGLDSHLVLAPLESSSCSWDPLSWYSLPRPISAANRVSGSPDHHTPGIDSPQKEQVPPLRLYSMIP